MPTTVAVDLAKSIFEVAVSEHPGRIRERHRLTRAQFERFIATRPAATIVMEACGTAHFWGRHAQAHGHRPILLPPHVVRPHVPRNKTDRADTKGLLEALRNEAIHPVPVKTLPQQTLGALHRLRSTWLATRTARINTVRGLLRELGISIPLGARRVVPTLRDFLDDDHSEIPPALRPALAAAADEIGDLEKRFAEIERQIIAVARQTPSVARLRTVPGIGLLIATSLVAFVGDPHRFPSGRHFASYLGLTPRESSSGLQRRLGAISKRGDSYLRMLLVHGARSFLWHAKKTQRPGPLHHWALHVEQQRGHNKAAVAVANKLARIAWAVWKTDLPFDPHGSPQD
jgi:transposase